MPLIQPIQTPNYAQLILQGLGAAQQFQGLRRGFEKVEQEKLVRELTAKAQSDPAALQQLMMIDPQKAAAIQQMMAQKERLQGQQRVQDLSGQALQDPAAMQQLAGLDPGRARQLQGFQGTQQAADQATQARFERERAHTSALIKDQPLASQIKTLDWRIDMIKQRGGDPSNTQGLRDLLASGDPRAIAQGQGAIQNAYRLGEMQGHIKPGKISAFAQQLLDFGIDPKSEQGMKMLLAKEMGQQISMTAPDGTEIRIGKGGPGGEANLEKKVRGDIQQTLVAGERQLGALDRLDQQFNKDFLTYQGRGEAWLSGIKSKAGISLSEDQKRFLGDRRRFTQNVNQFFNAYRKEITGAAASMLELESLKKALFNEDLSPDEFKAAFDEFKSEVLRTQRLNRRLLREGVEGSLRDKKSAASKQFDSLYLSGADDSPLDRITELSTQGMDKQKIFEALAREGYKMPQLPGVQ